MPLVCPLLEKDSPLPGTFDQVEALVAFAEREFGEVLDSEQLQQCKNYLKEARKLLKEEERYRVGFLGGSQLGKSKTINNICQQRALQRWRWWTGD